MLELAVVTVVLMLMIPRLPLVVPRLQATLSEKIRELNYVNDPWEGTGIEPTRWSPPFYGGHIVRTPEATVRAPGMASRPTTLAGLW